jgi:hypothetical protein
MAQAVTKLASKKPAKKTKPKISAKPGTSAERIALRRLLKDDGTTDSARKSIQAKIIESYKLGHAAAVEAKNSDKAKELKAKIEKFSKLYGEG